MKDLKVTLHVEPADRSVGIMTEGFSAWTDDGDSWCELIELVPTTFQWIGNETGDPVPRPSDAHVVEKLLTTFVDLFYAAD